MHIIEKSLTIASALAAIISAVIMCGQVVATKSSAVQPGPTPSALLQPCTK